ncbi:MAG: hypothetical protein HW375_765 [Anaerolineales bacterium]|nr:hypothetical protein [Anaerolineales bacterium]
MYNQMDIKTLQERSVMKVLNNFWAKVNKNGLVPLHAPHLGPCWVWQARWRNDGYGRFHTGPGTSTHAHRWAYEEATGPIPDRLELDHLCHNADKTCAGGVSCPHRACVRPTHLEPVSHHSNLLRSSLTRASRRICVHLTKGTCTDCRSALQRERYHRHHPTARFNRKAAA